MATIGSDKNGRRRILFYATDGKRKTIRLGKCSKRDADSIRLRVECLLNARVRNIPIDRDAASWLAGIDAVLRKRLEAVGLIEPVALKPKGHMDVTLADFLDGYMERYGPSKKPGTREVWRQVINDLNKHMPKGILLRDVTAGHAKNFHEALKASGMALTTVYKRVGFARQFLNDAVDWEYVDKNPFAKIRPTPSTAKSNENVPAEVVTKILKHCDTTWKVIVTLSRYGGMRCPSEVLSLKWSDVDFSAGRISIPEPKVEHHAGRGVRECPLFKEVRDVLNTIPVEERGDYVIGHPEYRRAANSPEGWRNANLRTQFMRVLKRAKVEPWNRIFHSMRATRQTELEAQFPLHVVCAWLGNSPRIAQRSYLLVTDDHFQKALKVKE